MSRNFQIDITGSNNDSNIIIDSNYSAITESENSILEILNQLGDKDTMLQEISNNYVTLKINNTYWSSDSYEYEKLLEFINRVDRSSGGMIKMDLVGNTGASAVPELFPKLQTGEYDGFVLPTKALNAFFQKNKVYELIGEPAAGAGLGYDYTLFSSWLETGGGYELLDQVTASDNFKMFPLMNVSPEGGGWFSKQISSLADLTSTTNQVVYRSPGGTVGRAYQAIDISVNLTLGSISAVRDGFESGIINAGEWAGIFPDVCFNFHTYAPYAMVGGVHQNIAITTFNLSTAALAKLSASQQELIKNLCRDEFNNTPGIRIEKNGKVLKDLVDAGSVTLMETPQDFIDAFRSAVKTIYESDKSGNALFTTVYNSLETFMQNNKDFRRLELDAMSKLSRSPVQNVPNTVLEGRMFLGDNLVFHFLSSTLMLRLRINPDVSFSKLPDGDIFVTYSETRNFYTYTVSGDNLLVTDPTTGEVNTYTYNDVNKEYVADYSEYGYGIYKFVFQTNGIGYDIYPDGSVYNLSYTDMSNDDIYIGLLNRNWWLNPMNTITDFVYNFNSALYDASQNVHLKGSETTPHPIAGNSVTYEYFQWVNTIITDTNLTVPASNMLLDRVPPSYNVSSPVVLLEIDSPN